MPVMNGIEGICVLMFVSIHVSLLLTHKHARKHLKSTLALHIVHACAHAINGSNVQMTAAI